MSFFHRINRTISNERFAAYKIQGGDDASAFSKYLWNVALCESLYPALNIIEVAYRNATHTAICATPIGADWLKQEIQILHSPEIEKIQKAKNNLKRRCKTVTEAYLVSELSFGFWDSLLNSRYETLWHKIIKDVFPNMPKRIRTRQEASSRMSGIRLLRNSALHHHSIWHWSDLSNKHAQIQEVLTWICPSMTSTLTKIDRFPSVFANGPGAYLEIAKALAQ